MLLKHGVDFADFGALAHFDHFLAHLLATRPIHAPLLLDLVMQLFRPVLLHQFAVLA